jgi:hypothetical protein
VHGFLVLRTLEGKALADGDLLRGAWRSGHDAARVPLQGWIDPRRDGLHPASDLPLRERP